MELYLLNKNFKVIDGPIDEFTSVVWRERFFEVGGFDVHFPEKLVSRMMNAVYVCAYTSEGEAKCGRIEYVTAGEDGDCHMGGSLLEVLFADRVVEGEGVYSGTVTAAVKSAVQANLRDCGVGTGACANIKDSVSLPYSWNNLSEWLYSVLKPYGASYTVTLDGDTGEPIFQIVQGKDRTVDGSTSQKAVFSTSFGNIASIRMQKNTGEMKNVAYVKGKDDTVVTVNNAGTGQRREIYVTASDIAPGGFDTTEAYTAALQARGEEILAKYPEGFWVNAECAADSLPKYGKDYFIGDICDVADERLGLSFGMRLTAVNSVWENGVFTVFPIFGEEVSYVKKLAATYN